MSDSPRASDLTIAVRSLTGETALVPVSLQPLSKLAIDVRNLLAQAGVESSGTFAEGSIAVYFVGTIMPVAGQLTATNPALRLIHESEMVENDPGRSDIPAALNAVWWGLAGGRDARIMVSNNGGKSGNG